MKPIKRRKEKDEKQSTEKENNKDSKTGKQQKIKDTHVLVMKRRLNAQDATRVIKRRDRNDNKDEAMIMKRRKMEERGKRKEKDETGKSRLITIVEKRKDGQKSGIRVE